MPAMLRLLLLGCGLAACSACDRSSPSAAPDSPTIAPGAATGSDARTQASSTTTNTPGAPATAPDAAASLRGATRGCNVLFITLDTTRADRIGCYGHRAAETPTLDVLAAGGVRFSRAYAHAPITLCSHATFMTGTLPPENGVRVNGWHALGPELPTLAEQFRTHGYATAAFVAARVLEARYGLNRGFDLYRDQMPATPQGGPTNDRPANYVVDEALAWLDSVAGSPQSADAKPWFCWTHLFDPHAPYAPPPPYDQRHADPYDGEIAFMDAQIGRLVERLRAGGLLERTLIVVGADHGESLGEHGYQWHALLVYDGIMRVPLIFHAPGRIPAATCEASVRNFDVMPTILDLMGWETPASVSGASLLPELAGEETGAAPGRPVYGESDFPTQEFGWAPLRFLVDGPWKYIRAPRQQLYRISDDPHERADLAGAEPQRVVLMEDALTALEAAMAHRDPSLTTLSAEDRRVLASLGYAGHSPPAASDEASAVEARALRDPHEHIWVMEKYRRAESLIGQRMAREALVELAPIAAVSPESFSIIELLGKAYAGLGVLDEAERALAQALELHPRSADTLELLARVLASQGKSALALKACEAALEYSPGHEAAGKILAELREQASRDVAEIERLEGAVKQGGAAIETRYALAELLANQQRRADAIRVLREGLAAAPDNAILANSLAWNLAVAPESAVRDGAEAVRLARLACSGEFADNPIALDTLAAALAESGDFDAAVRVAERALERARGASEEHFADTLELRLKRYRAREAYRAPS